MCALRPEHEAERLRWKTDQARQLQEVAPEVLDLEIISVDIENPYSKEMRREYIEQRMNQVAETLKVLAKVTGVSRSASNRQPNDFIHIIYQFWHRVSPGPKIYNPTKLQPADCVRAYLRVIESEEKVVDEARPTYEIAADLLSFEPCSSLSGLSQSLHRLWTSLFRSGSR